MEKLDSGEPVWDSPGWRSWKPLWDSGEPGWGRGEPGWKRWIVGSLCRTALGGEVESLCGQWAAWMGQWETWVEKVEA